MLYTINSNDVSSLIFSNIIAKTISKTPGMENFTFSNPTNKVVANFIGLEYGKVKDYIFDGTNTGTEAFMLMRGVIRSIDKRVEKFNLTNLDIDLESGLEDEQVAYRAYRKMVALEAEEEKEEDGNPFGETVTEGDVDDKIEKDESTIAVMVADLIKEIVSTDASEVKDLAERVVSLSKENNDMQKELAEDDEDMFSTVDDEEDENGEGSDSSEDEEGGNPFEGDKEKDGDNDSGNPFDNESSEDDKPDNDNPFDDEDGSSEDKPDKKAENPFADDNDNKEKDNKDNEDKTGEENQTRKLIESLEIRSFGLEKEMYTDISKFRPFADLKNDSFNKLAKYVADKMEGDNLYNAYTNCGVESATYIDARKEYSKTAKETMSAGIGAIMLASILNIPVESHKLNNIELFAE